LAAAVAAAVAAGEAPSPAAAPVAVGLGAAVATLASEGDPSKLVLLPNKDVERIFGGENLRAVPEGAALTC
jgi:hypothetical protein